jgi:solute carrier family 35 (GDP-fucose transporter), member C1
MQKFLVLGLYTFLAISLVIVNKIFLTQFNSPYFTLWGQSLASCMLLSFRFFDSRISVSVKFWDIFSFLNLIGFLSVVTSTLALQRVEASLFQIIARSLTIPLSVILSRVILKEKHGLTTLAGASVVTVGFLATIVLDQGLPSLSNPEGLFFGVVSAFVAAMHAVLIKQKQSQDPLNTVLASNIFSLVALVPLIKIYELQKFTKIVTNVSILSNFAWTSFVTGLLAVAFNVTILYQVRVTSPLSHMITSSFRGILQNLICMMLFHEKLTEGKLAGTIIVAVGTALYLSAKVYQPKTQRISDQTKIKSV